MKLILGAILLIGMASCTYEFLGASRRLGSGNDKHRQQLADQRRQIRKQDTLFGRDTTRGIYIREIMCRTRGGEGIYGYNSRSTHFGYVYFFQYKSGILTVLDRSNLDILQAKIETFLRAHNFNKRQIRLARARVGKIWNIHSTDSF